jgi:hypothetical protein
VLHPDLPNLQSYVVTSNATEAYNCIAWACGDNTKWWWPDNRAFWPDGIRCDETIEAFDDLFASGGAYAAHDESLEPAIIKIGLFALGNIPTHAARQLPNGSWTSKLGKHIDVSHSLRDVEGPKYGTLVRIYAVHIQSYPRYLAPN